MKKETIDTSFKEGRSTKEKVLNKSLKNNFKKSSGITLVTLVITIVVMLILVSIGFSIALGKDGLIAQSLNGKAKEESQKVYFNLKHLVTDTIEKGEEENLTADQIKKNVKSELNKKEHLNNLQLVREEYRLESIDAAKEKIIKDVWNSEYIPSKNHMVLNHNETFNAVQES